MQDIIFIDGETGQKRVEQVYGGALIKWLYQSPGGKVVSPILAQTLFSKLYGHYQDLPISKKKIAPFIKKFSISMDDFLPAKYASFNEFFTRKFRPCSRPFCQGDQFPAPCEGRYFAYSQISKDLTFPVKGKYLDYQKLLGHPRWSKTFAGGPLFIARLCPVDYHRFHFPDDGHYLDFYRIPGRLHSVNPMALESRGDIFITNERHVSILELKHFGKMAFIEVGATCVGRIEQLHPSQGEFKRGGEKGMFLFGGSTVIGIGRPGKWAFSKNLLHNTNNHLETYFKLGRHIASVNERKSGK